MRATRKTLLRLLQLTYDMEALEAEIAHEERLQDVYRMFGKVRRATHSHKLILAAEKKVKEYKDLKEIL